MMKLAGSLIATLIVWHAIGYLRESKCKGDLVTRLHCASIEVTKIPWRPISVFPEEAKRFSEQKNR
jgi:hypothetical protein